jgi:hypothetical protein
VKHADLARITSGRFFWLLVAMIAAIVIGACTPSNAMGRWEGGLPLIAILVAGTYAARGGRKRFVITLLMNGLLFAAGAYYFVCHTPASRFLCFGMLLACLLFTLLTTLSFVLTTGQVEPDHIYGAICSYVLIAMCFATIYTLQALTIPGAFAGLNTQDPAARPWEDLLYFSFTTLSTVGYGDITPVHHSVRAICIIEMLTGTFYVAILIARLAGLYPPPAHKDEGQRSA